MAPERPLILKAAQAEVKAWLAENEKADLAEHVYLDRPPVCGPAEHVVLDYIYAQATTSPIDDSFGGGNDWRFFPRATVIIPDPDTCVRMRGRPASEFLELEMEPIINVVRGSVWIKDQDCPWYDRLRGVQVIDVTMERIDLRMPEEATVTAVSMTATFDCRYRQVRTR